MARLIITLSEREFDRLYQTAQRELRQPRDQARIILRNWLFNYELISSMKNDETIFDVEKTKEGFDVLQASTQKV